MTEYVLSPEYATELLERLATLERMLGNEEWVQIGSLGGMMTDEFSTEGRNRIAELASIMYLKNPLIGLSVRRRTDYTFGRGINLKAADPDINDVIQAWVDDNQNKTELTSHISQLMNDHALQIHGNLFFTLFTHPVTGSVRVSSIPSKEVTKIITNPSNRADPWYYKREYVEAVTDLTTGEEKTANRTAYYIDWRFKGTAPDKIGGAPVERNVVIYHVKTGSLKHWLYGVSEVYAALDWARAYKDFLEDFATVMRSLARFAWRGKVRGGARGLAAVKRKLGTTVNTTSGVEANPAPTAGAIAFQDEGVDGNALEPIKTAGATTSAEEGRRIMLMVAAAVGLPETFYGDVSVGTLATAESLDRPTALMLGNRQRMWAAVLEDLTGYVIYQAVAAPQGKLRALGKIQTNEYNEAAVVFNEDVDSSIDIDFPSIVERNTEAYVRAIVTAATLDGKQPTLLNNERILLKLLLNALGEDNVDAIIDQVYPEDEALDTDEEVDAQGVPATLALSPVADETALNIVTEALRYSFTKLQEAQQ